MIKAHKLTVDPQRKLTQIDCVSVCRHLSVFELQVADFKKDIDVVVCVSCMKKSIFIK